MTTLAGREIVLGVTGGIAAYKACEIVRELRKEGANVVVVLTAAGAHFITPLTLQTLSKNPVHTDLFNLISESEIGHISLAQRANLLLVAPATANIIGKVRNGIADDLLSTIAMATTAPILMAPAMNSQMYASPAVRENIEVLSERGVTFVDPDEGELACGTTGPGRLADTGKILEMARILLADKILEGKKVVVSAGPTAEDIDPCGTSPTAPAARWVRDGIRRPSLRRGSDAGDRADAASGPAVPESRARAFREGDDERGVRGGGERGCGGHGGGGGGFPPRGRMLPEGAERGDRGDARPGSDGRHPRRPRRFEAGRVLVGFARRPTMWKATPARRCGGRTSTRSWPTTSPAPTSGSIPTATKCGSSSRTGPRSTWSKAPKEAIASAVWRAVCHKFLKG
jgi:hypothetical protein